MIGIIIASLLFLALLLFLISWRTSKSVERVRRDYSIPEGEATYSDLDKPARPLFSERYLIAGKPDYIVRDERGELIPVEVKSGNAEVPYRGHTLQLAAYCLLVEEVYGSRVPYGIIVYSDGKQHRIEYTEELKGELLSTVSEMRRALRSGMTERNHESGRRVYALSHAVFGFDPSAFTALTRARSVLPELSRIS